MDGIGTFLMWRRCSATPVHQLVHGPTLIPTGLPPPVGPDGGRSRHELYLKIRSVGMYLSIDPQGIILLLTTTLHWKVSKRGNCGISEIVGGFCCQLLTRGDGRNGFRNSRPRIWWGFGNFRGCDVMCSAVNNSREITEIPTYSR